MSRKIITPPGPPSRETALGPGGVRVPLPDRNLPIYTNNPYLQSWEKSNREYASPFFYSPFSQGSTQGDRGHTAEHGHEYIGGTSDLLPSVATRGIALQKLDELLSRTESGADARQTQGALQSYARQSDNPYLSAMASNMLPSVDRDYRLEDVQNRSALSDLLGQAYVLGGNILGSAWANTAYVNNYNNMIKQKKKDQIGALLGGIPYIGGIGQGIVGFT